MLPHDPQYNVWKKEVDDLSRATERNLNLLSAIPTSDFRQSNSTHFFSPIQGATIKHTRPRRSPLDKPHSVLTPLTGITATHLSSQETTTSGANTDTTSFDNVEDEDSENRPPEITLRSRSSVSHSRKRLVLVDPEEKNETAHKQTVLFQRTQQLAHSIQNLKQILSNETAAVNTRTSDQIQDCVIQLHEVMSPKFRKIESENEFLRENMTNLRELIERQGQVRENESRLTARITQLESELRGMRVANHAGVSEQMQLEDRLSQCQADGDSYLKKNNAMQKRLDELNTTLRTLTTNVENTDAKWETLNQDIHLELDKKIATWAANHSKEITARLDREHVALQMEASERSEALQQAMEPSQEWESKLLNNKTNIKKLVALCSDLSQRIDDLHSDVRSAQLSDDHKESLGHIPQMKRTVESLSADVKDRLELAQKTSQHLDEMKNKIQSAENARHAITNQVENVTSAIQREMKHIKGSVSSFESKMSERNQSRENELSEIKVKLDSLSSSLETTEEDVRTELDRVVVAVREEIGSLEERQRLSETNTDDSTKFEDTISDIQRSIESLSSRMGELEGNTNNQLDVFTKQTDQLRERVDSFEQQSKTNSDSQSVSKERMEDYNGRIENIERVTQELTEELASRNDKHEQSPRESQNNNEEEETESNSPRPHKKSDAEVDFHLSLDIGTDALDTNDVTNTDAANTNTTESILFTAESLSAIMNRMEHIETKITHLDDKMDGQDKSRWQEHVETSHNNLASTEDDKPSVIVDGSDAQRGNSMMSSDYTSSIEQDSHQHAETAQNDAPSEYLALKSRLDAVERTVEFLDKSSADELTSRMDALENEFQLTKERFSNELSASVDAEIVERVQRLEDAVGSSKQHTSEPIASTSTDEESTSEHSSSRAETDDYLALKTRLDAIEHTLSQSIDIPQQIEHANPDGRTTDIEGDGQTANERDSMDGNLEILSRVEKLEQAMENSRESTTESTQVSQLMSRLDVMEARIDQTVELKDAGSRLDKLEDVVSNLNGDGEERIQASNESHTESIHALQESMDFVQRNMNDFERERLEHKKSVGAVDARLQRLERKVKQISSPSSSQSPTAEPVQNSATSKRGTSTRVSELEAQVENWNVAQAQEQEQQEQTNNSQSNTSTTEFSQTLSDLDERLRSLENSQFEVPHPIPSSPRKSQLESELLRHAKDSLGVSTDDDSALSESVADLQRVMQTVQGKLEGVVNSNEALKEMQLSVIDLQQEMERVSTSLDRLDVASVQTIDKSHSQHQDATHSENGALLTGLVERVKKIESSIDEGTEAKMDALQKQFQAFSQKLDDMEAHRRESETNRNMIEQTTVLVAKITTEMKQLKNSMGEFEHSIDAKSPTRPKPIETIHSNFTSNHADDNEAVLSNSSSISIVESESETEDVDNRTQPTVLPPAVPVRTPPPSTRNSIVQAAVARDGQGGVFLEDDYDMMSDDENDDMSDFRHKSKQDLVYAPESDSQMETVGPYLEHIETMLLEKERKPDSSLTNVNLNDLDELSVSVVEVIWQSEQYLKKHESGPTSETVFAQPIVAFEQTAAEQIDEDVEEEAFEEADFVSVPHSVKSSQE